MQDQTRCDAKIEKVSQRIQFLTYARSRVKRTRKTAIKAIKNHGDHECNYRHVDSTIQRKAHRRQTHANCAQRHKVGQQCQWPYTALGLRQITVKWFGHLATPRRAIGWSMCAKTVSPATVF